MVARYADETKRLKDERSWLIVQTALWGSMALGAALVAWAGFAGLYGGPVSADFALILLIAGVLGVLVSGTLTVASVVELSQWSRTHRERTEPPRD